MKWLMSLAVVIALSPGVAGAKTSRQTADLGHVYVAAGARLVFPSTVRVGYQNWELGLLNGRAFGVNALASVADTLFFSVGPAFIYSAPSTVGLYTSMGVEFLDFGFGSLRFDLANTVSFDNMHSIGEALCGLQIAI